MIALLDETPILSAKCDEPEGLTTRFVRFMKLTPENLQQFWLKSRKFKVLFNSEIANDFAKFLDVFLDGGTDGMSPTPRGIFYVVDDFVGIFYMTEIIPGVDANLHYSFFDRRQKGRVQLVRTMIEYAFNHYQFRRLSAQVPLFVNKFTIDFLREIGFKREGRKRKARLYNGEWFDVNYYGILREEVLNGHAE